MLGKLIEQLRLGQYAIINSVALATRANGLRGSWFRYAENPTPTLNEVPL